MDVQKTIELFDDIIKQYEKSETYSILFYSTDFSRDFNILRDRVEKYRKRLNKILTDGIKHTQQVGDLAGEENI